MDFVRKKHAILSLKVVATICFGRYSGLVSYSLVNAPHPAKASNGSEISRAYLPFTALIGSACAMTVVFICKPKHRPKNCLWFLVGTVPIFMVVNEPFTGYALRNISDSDWYKFKKLRSLLALAVFSVCTISLAAD